jgi:hypothetical protein
MKGRPVMADNTINTREPRPEPEANAEPGPEILQPALDLSLFTTEEITRMHDLRERIEQGRMGELTDDYKRLMFARWLYRQGKIEG